MDYFIDMNKKDLYKKIGKNIQKERIKQNYSQETFAELMGVSWSYVSKIECGILNLSIGKIYDISTFLDINVKNLLFVDDE